MWNNLHWMSGMKAICVIVLLCQAIALCNAGCDEKTCTKPTTFDYEKCSTFYDCLTQQGHCTDEDRDKMMPDGCLCYVQCAQPFKYLKDATRSRINPNQGYCYFRGLLKECLASNAKCKGVTSNYLTNIATECPCTVENCLNGNNAYPGNTPCSDHIRCLGDGPVADNMAGCATAKDVRDKMTEKGIDISFPNGKWVLKKDCKCVDSCPGQVINYLDGSCSRREELIVCYEKHEGCSIEKYKNAMAPCECNILCKAEVAAKKAAEGGTDEEKCKADIKLQECKVKYGCQKKIFDGCIKNSGNGHSPSKWALLTAITATLMMPYMMNLETL